MTRTLECKVHDLTGAGKARIVGLYGTASLCRMLPDKHPGVPQSPARAPDSQFSLRESDDSITITTAINHVWVCVWLRK